MLSTRSDAHDDTHSMAEKPIRACRARPRSTSVAAATACATIPHREAWASNEARVFRVGVSTWVLGMTHAPARRRGCRLPSNCRRRKSGASPLRCRSPCRAQTRDSHSPSCLRRRSAQINSKGNPLVRRLAVYCRVLNSSDRARVHDSSAVQHAQHLVDAVADWAEISVVKERRHHSHKLSLLLAVSCQMTVICSGAEQLAAANAEAIQFSSRATTRTFPRVPSVITCAQVWRQSKRRGYLVSARPACAAARR